MNSIVVVRQLLFALTLSVACVTNVMAELPSEAGDYPQWRGPNRDGISSDKGLLKQWPSGGPKVVWQIDNIGAGYSSVSVKGDLVITMGDLEGVEHVIALDKADGSRVWAVQPAPAKEALQTRVNVEFKKLDRDENGTVSELEALSGLGWNFYKYDRGGRRDINSRAAKLFAALDKDNNGKLTYNETSRVYRDEVKQMDSSNLDQAMQLAERRTAALLKAADNDGDGQVNKKESRGSYLSVIFSKADDRFPGSRKGDGVLTEDEILNYLAKRERGQDGEITQQELTAHYEKKVKDGDGELSRDELMSFYGGYRNGQGDGPRGTPTIDGDRVYAEGGNGDLTCLDLKTGKTIWHKSLTSDFGGRRPGWGFSESPLIVNDWVIVTPGGPDGTLAALNKMTGETVWRSTDITEQAHYSSPILSTIAGREQIIQFARESMFGVSLIDGKLLWKYDGASNTTAN